MSNRFHITGGEDLSHAAALYRGDKVAIAALLASLPGNYHPIGSQPPKGNVIVGADVLSQPDGTTANVELLPLSPLAGYSVAAGASQDFELKPTRRFQPTALIIDDDIAKNLVMSVLQIGGKPVFCGPGVVVGRGFSHASFTNMISSFIADNATPIAFTLHNIHASAAQVIRGHWVGNSAEK
jgi:hypothetical protein